MRYILFIILFLAVSPVKAITLSEYETIPERLQNWHIGGIIDGIMVAQSYLLLNGSQEDLYCAPTSIVYNYDLAKAALQTFKRSSHNNDPNAPLGVGVLVGLKLMFPCK